MGVSEASAVALKNPAKMRPEDKLLFACTRQTFLEAHRQTVLDLARRGPISWDEVYATALAHGVAPLVYANLRRCADPGLGVPKGIMDQFQACFFRNMVVKEHKAEILRDVLAFFHQKAIDVMLIKGTALDLLVYDHPYYTTSNDIDIVLKMRREDLTDQANGQIGVRMHGLGIEYDYFEHHDTVMNNILPVDFQRIWAEASKIDFRGQTAFVMSPEDMLLSACINSCRKRFFRLKSLSDMAEIVNQYPDLNWDKLARRARAFDCHNIVYAALLVTKMTLGDGAPDAVFGKLQVSSVRAGIIRALIYLLSHRMSLSTLYPFSGRMVFGRAANPSLLLPYATYRWYQLGRKMKEINNARQPQT